MKFYTSEKIGETRYFTPEGYLVCVNVPIARTGVMVYGDGEVPIEPGRDGIVRVDREDSEVFSEETIASFVGKPITDDHPDEDVTSENWKELAKGELHNVRRGSGIWNDCLVADLFVKDKDAIQTILDGKVEISCGYDADYEQIEPGRGRQHNIIGNHVALVENGRCGPRCSIGDNAMAKASKKSWKDTIRGLLQTRRSLDEQMENLLQEGDVMDEAEGSEASTGSGETHVHVHLNGAQGEAPAKAAEVTDEGEADPMEARIAALETSVKAIADAVAKLVQGEANEPAPTGDEAEKKEDEKGDGEKTADEDKLDEGETMEGKTIDSASLLSEFTDVKSRAEIIAPGIKFPTFDAKAGAKKVRDNLCALRRKALTVGLETANADMIRPLVTDVKKMTCDSVTIAFVGASELIRQRNNDRGIGYDKATRDTSSVKISTIHDINEANRKFWAARS